MPVDTTHPRYVERELQWQQCRDAIAGEDAVKARDLLYSGVRSPSSAVPSGWDWSYLPKLGSHYAENCNGDVFEASARRTAYVLRALFYPVARRTVQGLAGAATRNPPELVDFPAGHEDLLGSATDMGATLQQLCGRTMEELLK